MAKKYVSLNSLIYLVELIKGDFKTKVSYTDIVNELSSNEVNKPLSAAQGKELSTKIDTEVKKINTTITSLKITDGKVDSSKNADTATNATQLGGLPAAKYVHTEDDGKIASSYLPSYVDDVIEGYYHNGNFYKEAEHESQITAETGKIYVDLTVSTEPVSYRYSGSVFTQIVSSDMVEITNDEITNIWSPST